MEEKDGGLEKKKTIVVCIDASKRETHHAGNGFKKLFRRLRSHNYKPMSNKEDLCATLLSAVDVLVIGAPRERFTADELKDVKDFVADGGSLIVLASEGGEQKLGCNINELLEGYGMSAQPDAVLRTVYYKYLHPKEVYVSHGVLQPELATHKHLGHGSHGRKHKRQQESAKPADGDAAQGGGLAFVYPRGSTLSVQRPARAVLSSGAISYPIHRTVCAAWEGAHPNGERSRPRPRVVSVGAVEMFSDEWIDKEENGTLSDLLFKWLARDPEAPSLVSAGYRGTKDGGKDDKAGGAHHSSSKHRGGAKGSASPSHRGGNAHASSPSHRHHHHHPSHHSDAKGGGGGASSYDDGADATFELSGEHHHTEGDATYARVPDIEALASRLRACLQENDELPRNFTRLFNDALFRFDTDVIPEVVQLYEQLNVKHEALSLIPPSFEYPLPPLQPATFPPALREPPNPPLDQFDLDEHFASKRERLAQLTNKCIPGGAAKRGESKEASIEPDDLEYYVREAGEIVGATAHLAQRSPENVLSAKHILAFVLSELVTFKKVNPQEDKETERVRRAGAEDSNPQHRSAGTIIASTEPIKKRAQLTHLTAYDSAEAKSGLEPLAEAKSGARPVSRGGVDDKAGRPPLRAFGGDDAAETKNAGDQAEVMSFK